MLRYSAVGVIALAACTNAGSGEGAPRCAVDNAVTTINTAAVEGRYLHLNVGFGGGCEEHDFVLEWFGGVGASDPPVVEVKLKHDGHGDMCEAYETRDLYFDLSSLDATLALGGAGNSAHLVLEGSGIAMTYTTGQPDAPPNADVAALQLSCGME